MKRRVYNGGNSWNATPPPQIGGDFAFNSAEIPENFHHCNRDVSSQRKRGSKPTVPVVLPSQSLEPSFPRTLSSLKFPSKKDAMRRID